MSIIALDVHRSFAQTAILENGKLRDAGKIDLEYSRLLRFAGSSSPMTRLSSRRPATPARSFGCSCLS